MTWLYCRSAGALSRYGIGLPSLSLPSASDAAQDLAVPDFDVRELLGRKGSSTLDRISAMCLIAAQECLKAAPNISASTGVTVGTTMGSIRSTMDYSAITLLDAKPYAVPPSLFPNTVMNCAAGLVAIRHRLNGPNTTIAGGRSAGHKSVQFVELAMDTQQLQDCVLVSAEELTEERRALQRATSDHFLGEISVALLLSAHSSSLDLCRLRCIGSPDLSSLETPIVTQWNSTRSLFSLEREFGDLGAGAFGGQVLMALSLLHAGFESVLLEPGDPVRDPWIEVSA